MTFKRGSNLSKHLTFPQKKLFIFIILLITFEPHELEKSYIAFLKAIIHDVNAFSGCPSMFILCLNIPEDGSFASLITIESKGLHIL